jgi:hypothetical protein
VRAPRKPTLHNLLAHVFSPACSLSGGHCAACAGDVEALPEEEPVCYGVMKMYFHWGYDDFVLFRGWVPCTAGAYVGTVVAVMAAAILSALLKAVRSRCEQTWVRTAAVQPAKAPSTTWALLPSDMGEARQNATRMLFIMVDAPAQAPAAQHFPYQPLPLRSSALHPLLKGQPARRRRLR